MRPGIDIIKGESFRESNKFFKGTNSGVKKRSHFGIETILTGILVYVTVVILEKIMIICNDSIGKCTLEKQFYFTGVTMEVKRQGTASIDHHPPICDADLQKMYRYLISSDSAIVLQHKVLNPHFVYK